MCSQMNEQMIDNSNEFNCLNGDKRQSIGYDMKWQM